MKFLALIIALSLARFRGAVALVHRDAWFRRWQTRVATWQLGSAGRLATVILPPLVVAQLLLSAVQSRLFGALMWIALAVVMLLYALGRGDLQQRMARYRRQCRATDFEGAFLDTLSAAGVAGAPDAPQSPEAVHALVQRGFFYEGYQRWFPALFYFVLLGPVGALAYRLLQLCRDNVEPELAARCIVLADWVPARLLAATFSVTGDFVGSRNRLCNSLVDLAAAPSQLLYEVGTAALETPGLPVPAEQSFSEFAARQNEDTGKLLARSAICWVALIALIVLLA
jgi:AmpE protein